MPLTADSILARNRGALSAPLDGDLILLNPLCDNYVCLDDIGRHLWELLAEPRTVRELCGELAARYGGDRERIETDTMRFLNDLIAEGLVVESPVFEDHRDEC
jgi:hypothetical protein